jgi:S1-C subfamily serine protease/pSer/pThr/pTyr-binding forkhead associated (FHA) protein
MPIELRIVSGARAGHTQVFETSVIGIGRHPMSDLKFDPNADLDVSARHGEIRLVGDRYAIYDSNSTNGTFVNGQRVPSGSALELHHNDLIAFGAQGPIVTVTLAPELTAMSVTTGPEAPHAARGASSDLGANQELRRTNTTERIAIAVRQQTRRLWTAIVVLVVALAGTAAAMAIRTARQSAASQAEIARLVEQNESITRGFQERLRDGDTALANRMAHVNDSLVRALRQATNATQMAAAEAGLRKNHDLQRQITKLDFTAISTANDPAVVLIVAQSPAGSPLEATGFCVGAKGLIATNRHVVAGSIGRSAAVKVKFANTGRWYSAHVTKLPDAADIDLALLQIDEAGTFPVVSRLATAVDLQVGEPVATIGYPLGTDIPMDGTAAKTSTTFGNVSKVVPDLLQIDAFASHGSSGSPVFDAHGHVVGVVWGGPPGADGRIVFSVPVDQLNELLRGR